MTLVICLSRIFVSCESSDAPGQFLEALLLPWSQLGANHLPSLLLICDQGRLPRSCHAKPLTVKGLFDIFGGAPGQPRIQFSVEGKPQFASQIDTLHGLEKTLDRPGRPKHLGRASDTDQVITCQGAGVERLGALTPGLKVRFLETVFNGSRDPLRRSEPRCENDCRLPLPSSVDCGH